ncbi:phosphonate C-P lyase system protein PhnG [uncultured Metabacillus sp.]|uniref:phosphonate C-P lyase system protein PhnG n=1 Tax=uncultured Metabacillus sp. TaxID=2860135 RepID=UPI002621F5E1|nr:phosphonate C-P lyase system protein PhnG [uncultured Metabacillus sp.]
MKKSRLMKILVEGRPEFLAKWTDAIEKASIVSVDRAPSTGLVMLKTRDSVSKQPFYMGEVLVTECSVSLDQHSGIGIVMGDDPVRSYQIAVIDAAMNAKLPITNQLLIELEFEEAYIQQKVKEEAARIAKTKVQFDTMEDYNAKS